MAGTTPASSTHPATRGATTRYAPGPPAAATWRPTTGWPPRRPWRARGGRPGGNGCGRASVPPPPRRTWARAATRRSWTHRAAMCWRSDARRAAHAAAAATLLLAGCATLAPPIDTPAMPVPQRYAGAAQPGGAVAAATAWRDYVTDPRLQALIAQALEHNRDLRAAALRVQEARAAYGIQGADQFPNVRAQASVDRARTPADLSPTGRPLRGSQYQAGLGLASWEIDFWGRVRSLREAALENYLASDAARRAVTVSLVAQVANGYLALRELDERLALAEQSSASRAESLRISRRR